MNRFWIFAVACVALLSGVANADERADRWGKRGVGAGAAAGAILAGPPGALLGAGFGGFFAERLARAQAASDLETDLALAQSDLDEMRAAMERSRGELAVLRADLSDRDLRIAELEHGRRVTTGLEMEVLFRTGGREVEQANIDRIERLAVVLLQNPDLSIRLDGYADPRGETGSNLSLSEDRNDSVREELIARGVDPRRIETHAHGDTQSRAVEGDLDGYALERRVRIRLEDNDAEARVANSD